MRLLSASALHLHSLSGWGLQPPASRQVPPPTCIHRTSRLRDHFPWKPQSLSFPLKWNLQLLIMLFAALHHMFLPPKTQMKYQLASASGLRLSPWLGLGCPLPTARPLQCVLPGGSPASLLDTNPHSSHTSSHAFTKLLSQVPFRTPSHSSYFCHSLTFMNNYGIYTYILLFL